MSSAINISNKDAWIEHDPAIGKAKTGILDFSWLNDPPAGKHGFVRVRNGGFVFDDGTPIKFFGVNLGFAAALPDKIVADAMAEDLYRSGANIARIHAIDCTYGGIIDYSLDETGYLNDEMLDRLDYLIARLKEKGIYIHLDTCAGRAFKSADGFSEDELAYVSLNSRAVRFFDERIIRLEKEFIARVLNHVNPYTGLPYKDEPAIAILQYANENSITWYSSAEFKTGAFDNILDKRFNLWLLEKYNNREGLKRAWTNADGKSALGDNESPEDGTVIRPPLGCWCEPLTEWNNPITSEKSPIRHAEHMRFLMELQEKTFDSVYKMVRDLGFRSAINCSNYPEAALDAKMNSLGDVMEKNPYWNHPIGNYYPPTEFYPDEMTGIDPREKRPVHNSHSIGVASRASVCDKPFMITEWNSTTPTPFRADGIFQIAAYGALQGWNGFTLFIYTFDGDKEKFFGNRAMTSFFSANVDPAVWGQFGIAAAIFRLNLIAPARNSVESGVSSEDLFAQSGEYWRLPMIVPFVSKFSYRFFDDTYKGDADMVISSGSTASGDYRHAKRALVHAFNPFSDALQKKRGRSDWLKTHTEENHESLMIPDSEIEIKIGKKRAVAYHPVSNTMFGKEKADEVISVVMRKFGLLNEDQGWFPDRVVSDTSELVYHIGKSAFLANAPNIGIFAGNTSGDDPVGVCSFRTKNDRVAIAVMSFDKSISSSEKLLVYCMGRCTNTDEKWDGMVLLDHGKEPVIYENITGELIIPSVHKKCVAWRLDSCGNRVEKIQTGRSAGTFVVHIGGGHLYELQLS